MIGNNAVGRWDRLGLKSCPHCCGGKPLPAGMKCCGSAKSGTPYNPMRQCCKSNQIKDLFIVSINSSGTGKLPWNQGHTWISAKNLFTGAYHTYGVWDAISTNKGVTGLNIDQEITPTFTKKGRREPTYDEKPHVSRSTTVCDYKPTPHTTFSGCNDNCASYARDEWNKNTGESISAGMVFDAPVNVADSIERANRPDDRWYYNMLPW